MRVLGIETSCDETAAAVVVRDAQGRGRIVANVVRSQWEAHRPFGGVVPEIAARAHVECLDTLIAEALEQAGCGFAELDAVAATAGPGLNGGLIVGVVTGKALALAARKPFLAINHLEAHALTVGLTDGVRPPYLLLLVSGGHTQTLLVEDVGCYRRLGTTIDDALGEAFDKTAKLLGLGQPGGPVVERLARIGDPRRFELPRPLKGRAEPHFSFAGLKTAVRRAAIAGQPLSEQDIADLCAGFEAAVSESVIDRVSRAMDMVEEERRAGAAGEAVRQFVVAGGVAANARLRADLTGLAASRGMSFHVAPVALCGDNAAMVAWTGAERFARGWVDGLDAVVRPRWPLDPDAAPAIGAGVKA
ncbi:MAG: tRNA (adenosine(37)-N6)-threonylcarbamoyltransferase complex transferase subunit TsaD [Hyphomicrobiaceae bacterium]